jgi:hypothetical protein
MDRTLSSPRRRRRLWTTPRDAHQRDGLPRTQRPYDQSRDIKKPHAVRCEALPDESALVGGPCPGASPLTPRFPRHSLAKRRLSATPLTHVPQARLTQKTRSLRSGFSLMSPFGRGLFPLPVDSIVGLILRGSLRRRYSSNRPFRRP